MKILYIALLFSLSMVGQSLEVKYDFMLIDEKDQYGIIRAENITLITTQNESILKRVTKDTIFTSVSMGIFESGEGFMKYNLQEFKNLSNGDYYFFGPYVKSIVKDSGYKIQWELQKEHKTLLNYKCQKAIGSFRGRNYIAYFVNEIPVQNGPFKFDGLPGLILEVKSDDGIVVIKANSIQTLTDYKIVNPFYASKTINYDQFIMRYNKYFDSIINYKSDNDSDIYIPKRDIEVYVK